VEVVSALPPDNRGVAESRWPGGFRDGAQEQRRQRLDELVKPLRKRIEVEVTIRTGTPALEIIRDVLRGERDLVVKAAEVSVGIRRRLFQNTDMQLLRKCPCPVWFVRPKQFKPYRRIMAAVDVDFPGVAHRHTEYALNQQILESAFSLALIELAELHVVHVWQAYGEDILRSGKSPFPQRDTDAYVEREQKRHLDALQELLSTVRTSVASKTIESVKVHVHLVNGDPRIEITRLAQSQDVDLLIIGTAAYTGIRQFILGSTAQAIFYPLKCSVLVVKPPDFVTPITVED
jgi:nucleotide-binding universal stress UspA family protein